MNKGITLVTLIVTIIVMLILAGVTLNITISQQGIIEQTKDVEIQSKIKSIEDVRDQWFIDIKTSAEAQTTSKTLEEILTQLKEQGLLTQSQVETILTSDNNEITIEGQTISFNIESNEEVIDRNTVEYFRGKSIVQKNTQIRDTFGNKIIIPNGFKIAEDSGINILEGIVIEDDDYNELGRGNQFVWIPIGTLQIDEQGHTVDIELGRYSFDKETGEETLVQPATNYATIVKIGTCREVATYALNSNLGEFITKATNSGGYYIARYESSYGVDKKPNSKISTIYNKNVTHSKEGELWGGATRDQAVKYSTGMYTSSDFTSCLVKSYMWDTAIIYIQKCSDQPTYSIKNSMNTSLTNTGTIGDEVLKINDMSSNLQEFTTEHSTYVESDGKATPCVSRGGSYDSATARPGGRASRYTSAYARIAFRVAIYL